VERIARRRSGAEIASHRGAVRICGPPTVRDASASAQRAASGDSIASV
jgi:hypothetical protein